MSLPLKTQEEGNQYSPDYVQTSTAAAMTLGFIPGLFYRDAVLKGLNLLLTYEQGCAGKCSYCGLSQTRQVHNDDKSFIRVSWPNYSLEDILQRVKENPKHISRVCVSMITHGRAFSDLCYVVKRFKDETDLYISALISPTVMTKPGMLQQIKDAGADMVGIAVDCATEELFKQERGEGVGGPHRWEHYWNIVTEAVTVFGRYKAGVHLIVGLGETEQEMIEVIQRAQDIGAHTHLFSFFPEMGSTLETRPQPPMGQYRRIQVARYIINKEYGRADKMTFNQAGQVTDFGISPDLLEQIIVDGEAFMTSGCPGKDGKTACNRPYGNERPSQPIRNFPFQPEPDDIALIREQLWSDLK